ncbi:conjugal transfer protein TrbF [Terricaulis silvestris]|uniref:Conjugal transfer protein TrbF n=1 Tax=Terricaulis silvestris TaxID=2686094 RepID=A0A6I6MQ94_9CAUL|nr:conjugal transfer protein TrbF [Terricaulis silvestris]QGZ94957.1 conjugal transfer protein TrbF [Terricaulis silvestris]
MNFPFRSPARSYAPEPADTPYRRAQQEWDARMGSAVLSARAWRGIAFCSLALAAILGASLTAVALQKRTFVHVVEVAPEGQVMNVRAADGRWSPSNAQVAFHLGHFIRLVRSLPTDGVVLRENWLQAYRFLTPQAAAQLTEIARQDDPFLSLGRVGRTVHIRSIIARSNNAWEVSWVERATNATGTTDPEIYTGVFTVTTRAPRNADEIANNPLGLLISDFSWSRER